MKFQRKQVLIGIPLFAIVYGMVVYFALKTEYTIPILIGFGVLVMMILMIADSIERRIKGNPSEIKNDINFPYFVGLTLIVTLFTCFLLITINNIHYKINGVETYATIYDIDKKVEYKTEYDEDGNAYEKKEEHCDVYIKYNVDGKEYDTTLDISSCKNKIGQEVKIYYDKDDPSKFVSDSSPILLLATAFVGFGLGLFLYMTYKDLFAKRKGKRK